MEDALVVLSSKPTEIWKTPWWYSLAGNGKSPMNMEVSMGQSYSLNGGYV